MYISKEELKEAYQIATLMSSYSQVVDVLWKEINERIAFAEEQKRLADVARWIKEEKKERAEEKARMELHKDDDDWSYVSPPPNAKSYSGITICGWCLGEKDDPLPPEGCFNHYWDKKATRVQSESQRRANTKPKSELAR